jgi:predicted esterase
MRCKLIFPLLLLLSSALHAAEPAGKLYKRVALRDHPDQFYAAWLPEGAQERPLPLLVVLDPRGRALEAMELFLPAAQRLGWIVVSSYESLSDEGSERNAVTLPALLADLERKVLVAEKRVYFAGFSGTARTAYELALRLGENAGGVIANCGGLPPGVLAARVPFAYFGATGTLDYNYAETLRLAEAQERLGATNRAEIFDGEHAWGPPEMMSRAVYWLELQAIRNDLRPRDRALIAEIFAGDLAAAEQRQPLERLAAYRQLERDFAGMLDLGMVPSRRAALEGDAAVQTARKERDSLLSLEEGYRLKVSQWRQAFSQTELPLPLNRSLSMLSIPSLQKEAAGGGDAALSAQRRLRVAFSESNHYLPYRLEAAGQLRHAAASYELATQVRPESFRAHLNLARAELRIGRQDEARKALARALERGADRRQLAGDASLAPLLEHKTGDLPG